MFDRQRFLTLLSGLVKVLGGAGFVQECGL